MSVRMNGLLLAILSTKTWIGLEDFLFFRVPIMFINWLLMKRSVKKNMKGALEPLARLISPNFLNTKRLITPLAQRNSLVWPGSVRFKNYVVHQKGGQWNN